MVDAGEKATSALKREFIEEAMNSNKGKTKKNTLRERKNLLNEEIISIFSAVTEMEKFFDENGVEVYSGYVDDPRNTDNAWMETTAYNFHDESGDILKNICFEAGDDAGKVKWLDINQNLELYASHREILEQVATRLNAHW